MSYLNLLIKPASGLCNYRCTYCFYADEMKNRSQSSYGMMSKEVQEQLVKKAFEYATKGCNFFFQGGEPTLTGMDFYEHFVTLVNRYNVNKIPVSYGIQTNGSFIDDGWCSFFAKHHFLVGLSLDGIKSTHDFFRKNDALEDTYFQVIKAAELFTKYGVDFNILTVINAKTAPKIRRIYEQYKRQGFMWQQYIACLDPIDVEPGKKNYSLAPYVYGQCLIDLFDLWQQDLENGEQPYIRAFENYVGILLGAMPESCEQSGMCARQNVVEADGSIYPCDFYVLDEYKIGNITKDDFFEIEKKSLELCFEEKSLNHSDRCKACKYFKLCRGGCNRHRTQPGSLEGENYFCESYKMFFDRWLDRLIDIANKCRG